VLLANDQEAAQALAGLGHAGPGQTAGSDLASLESQIAQLPHEKRHYLELAGRLAAEHRYEEAEATLAKARPILGGVPELTEKLEEIMVLRAKRQLEIAEKQAQPLPPLEAIDLVDQAKANLARVELQVLSTQSQRRPQDKRLVLEIGRRLKQLRNYSEAIKYFGEAAQSSDLAAAAKLEIGECWQHLRQFSKAKDFYENAIPLAKAARDEELEALACYRLGVLADSSGDYSAARDWYRQTLTLRPAFKDAQARLDKLPPG
jgi:tetratricopeptide (TPR) repeat protein